MSFDPSPSPDPQPRLFAERPVRSDFAHRRGQGYGAGRGPSYAMRRMMTLGVLAALIGGGVFCALHRDTPTRPEDIPTVKAEGPYRQRPQQPGGLEIPHQDVEVYQQLDKPGAAPAAMVEHLLPPPEMPQLAVQALAQAPVTHNDVHAPPAAVAPDATPDLTGAKPLVESLTPIKPPDNDDVLGEKTPPPVVPTTVMSAPPAITPQTPAAAAPAISAATAVTPATVMPPAQASAAVAAKATAAPEALTPAPSSVSHAPKTMEQLLKNIDAETKSAAAPVAPVPTASVSGASGNRAIQLTSVPDQAAAGHAMAQLQKKYAATLNGVALRVVKADLGAKGIHYRVESVPVSSEQAHALCAALKQQSAGCILVHP